MQISGISNTIAASMTYQQNKSTGTNEATSFQQVQESLCNEETDKPCTFSETDLPLQAYTLPSWYNDYLVDAMVVIPKIYKDLFDFDAQFAKESDMSDNDPDQIDGFIQNDAIDQDFAAKQEFRNTYKDELEEYYGLLENYFQESLTENGVHSNSQAEYYDMAINNKRYSNVIHQSMQKRIENDPRLLELMELFGIQSSV